MKLWLQSVIGLVTTGIVLFVCFAFFAVKIATRSHPAPYRETETRVSDSTFIYRNSFGIPHVVGKTLNDALFAQGYVHAQDRLWQMDMWRRTGYGTLAEILGKEAVESDMFLRAVDIKTIVKKQYAASSSTTKKILKAYADGVNAYIEHNESNLPFEFDALGYTPQPWKPEDCLIVGRVLAFELSVAFWGDLAFSQIAAQRGHEAYKMYVPTATPSPYVLGGNATQRDTTPVMPGLHHQTQSQAHLQHTLQQELFATITRVRTYLGMHSAAAGSNCWAVANKDNGVIVANDPHLSVSLPPKWYQIHISAPGFNVLGQSIPGMPLVFSGMNDKLAWGFSNSMVDDVDYVVERVDSSNSNYYFDTDGRRTKFKYRRDTIRVKKEDRIIDSLIDYRITKRSIVLSDVHPLKNPSALFGIDRKAATTLLQKSCLTFLWTARYPSDEVLAMYNINKANTFNDFVAATSTWAAPVLNFSVGTAAGAVGTVVAGVAPIRGTADPRLFIPAWDANAAWKGTTNLRTLGTLTNPSTKFVFSANNTISNTHTNYLSSYFEPSSRATRIDEQLHIYTNYSVRDAQVMQQDVTSPYAKSLLQRLLPLLKKGNNRYGNTEKNALKILTTWDYSESAIDAPASVYAVLLQRLLWNTFEDELGQQLYFDYTFVGSVPLRRIDELINVPDHPLFDDSRTPQREDLSWIVVRSFIEACTELRTTMQTDDVHMWGYGSLHTVTFPHVFGKKQLMKPTMNQGPFAIGGSATTINNTEWAIYNPYQTRTAASMRVISSFRDSVQYTVVPGGSSGQPLDPHYSDQMQLWLKGGYVRIPRSPKPDIAFTLYNVFLPRAQ